VHHPHQVGLDDPAEDLGGDLLEGAVGHRRGVVDPDVDPAVAALDRGGEGVERLLVGDVDRLVQDRGADGFALNGDLGQRSLRPRAEPQRGAASCDPQRRRAADPARGAGDDDDGFLQRSRHAPP
jgi:hypothetical protein